MICRSYKCLHCNSQIHATDQPAGAFCQRSHFPAKTSHAARGSSNQTSFFLSFLLTLSLPECHLKITPPPPPPPLQVCNLKFLCSFFLFFTFKLETTSIKMHDIESDTLQDRKIHSLQACECIFLPGNFTDCGSEGVNTQ